MVQFRLFGIPVTVQPWHWLLLGVFGFMMAGDNFLHIGLFVLAGFLSVLVHELGHALTGMKFGSSPQIVLHGMGGVAIFPQAKFTRPQFFLVTAAGPAVQLILGLLALAALLFAPLPNTDIRMFFFYLTLISIFWALLNLVPVSMLDGGQMVHSVLGPKRRMVTLQISIVTAIVAGGLLFLKIGSILFPLLMLHAAYLNFQELKAISTRSQ